MSDACSFVAPAQDANVDGCTDTIDDVQAVVEGLGLPKKDEKDILKSIDKIMKSLEKGKDKDVDKALSDLIKKLKGKKGKDIPEEDRAMLIEYSKNLLLDPVSYALENLDMKGKKKDIDDFISQIQAEAGAVLTVEQARILVKLAEQIILIDDASDNNGKGKGKNLADSLLKELTGKKASINKFIKKVEKESEKKLTEEQVQALLGLAEQL